MLNTPNFTEDRIIKLARDFDVLY
ncbi:hypothetical protein N7457_006762 [Penicillium paradoxum]|nr:hypothetical protein N7457_006762 [Penicillium paradoxum]